MDDHSVWIRSSFLMHGEAIRAAAMLARPGDIVLLAGKGHETYQIVGDERRHFDDRQQIEHQFSIHR